MASSTFRPDVLCVVGARPNFMKIAPIMRALQKSEHGVTSQLLHTGQHYDAAMKHSFFEQLAIPEPDVDLGVGSGSHAVQTAEIMKRFEPALDSKSPSAVLVVGDVNSTIACSLVAVKKGIPVIHVEAGLRSGDRTMPEEINRILTDQISDLLFTTERFAKNNLIAEGINPARIYFCGNVMIDSLYHNLERAMPAFQTWSRVGRSTTNKPVVDHGFGLVTLHRPSNVDDPKRLEQLLSTLTRISQKIPLIFPIHPRTLKSIVNAGLEPLISKPGWVILPPVSYLEMLGLLKEARLVLTDSGGIQEETTALGVPCVTLRENTERPITVEEGTNTVVGSDPEKILACVEDILSTGGKAGKVPELWDGRAAERIADNIGSWLKARK